MATNYESNEENPSSNRATILGMTLHDDLERNQKADAPFDEDASLAYSRASGYFSAGSEEQQTPEDSGETYYHPAFPTPAETEQPPTYEVPRDEPPKPSEFESFIASPIEYVFGGNEDDVSTEFHDSYQWDSQPHTRSSMAGMRGQQPTIYENDLEEEEEEEEEEEQHRKSISFGPSRTKLIRDPNAPLLHQESSIKSRGQIWTPSGNRSNLRSSDRRSLRSRQSWRSLGPRSNFHQAGAARSAYTSPRTMMPETPEVLNSGDGGPMMTRGMSGRAVVHISMEHGKEGNIDKIQYTTPVVDPPKTEDEVWRDEIEEHQKNTPSVPWYDYYFTNSRFVRKCHSKQCYRINAILFVIMTVVTTIVVGAINLKPNPTKEAVETPEGRKAISLDDLTPPPYVKNVQIPSIIGSHLKDWFQQDGKYAASEDDVPFYFHIPMSGAQISIESWGSCLGFTIACDAGGASIQDNSTLKVVQVYGASYVNVNTATSEGIARAAELGLVPSSLPDAVFSPLFGEVTTKLYSRSHSAKLILTMRHPVDREVAVHTYMATATWDPSYKPEIASMTLEEYALSSHIDNNYVTRLLTGKSGGALKEADLNVAKEILRRKAVVGIYEAMQSSMEHIEKYFGWTPSDETGRRCTAKVVADGMIKGAVERLDKGSTAYALIAQQNQFDIQLYEYVRNFLVPYQREVVSRQLEAKSAGPMALEG